MHQYSIDTNNRSRVVYALVVVSILVSIALDSYISAFFVWIEKAVNSIVWLSELIRIMRTTGVLPDIIGVPFLYWLLSFLFENYLWKKRIFQRLLGVPNLNGEWLGKLHSSFDDKEYEMNLYIKQTWTKIQCTAFFEHSRSYSNIAAVYSKGPEGKTLFFGFHNQSDELDSGIQQYDGYNVLSLKGNALKGKYCNDRPNPRKTVKGGNTGTIVLTKKETRRNNK